MIAESNVESAACDPEAVVKSTDETPAPKVCVAATAVSFKPEAVNAAAVMPDTLIPAELFDDRLTLERVVFVPETAATLVVAVADANVVLEA